MFRANRDKIEFYLSNKLAEWRDHCSIRLLFQPKGLGHSKSQKQFFMQERENRCSVCGSSELLSRHHIIPACYRKWFTDKKNLNYHDIVPLCLDCHLQYEKHCAYKLKRRLAHKFKAPINGLPMNGEHYLDCVTGRHMVCNARSLVRHRQKMPADRIKVLEDKLTDFLGHQPNQQELEVLAESRKYNGRHLMLTHGKKVISHIQDQQQQFSRIWRKHFMRSMRPEYLPDHWDINFPIYYCD